MAAPKDQPPRRLEYQRLDDVRPAARNPKGHDEAFLDGSVERWGFTEPILLDERTGRLIVGHGRLESLQRKKAGGDDVPEGIIVDKNGDWLLPVVRGWSSVNDTEAEAYLIVSNRSPERGGWKPTELAEMLAEYEQQAAGFALGVGFDDDQYRNLLQETGLLGSQETNFLDDLDGPLPDVDPAGTPPTDRARTGTDVVDFRLAMVPADREECIVILRRQAKARGKDTLAAALLDILRGLTAEAPAPA